MKRFAPLALLVMFASGFALAEWYDDDWWDAWDADSDGALSQDEFLGGWNEYGLYDDWDLDDDGYVDEDEFGTGLYDYYDADDNGDLTNEEFDIGDDPGDAGFWDV